MNPVTFLLVAAILVALGAGWVSWLLFGIAVLAALTLRGVAVAIREAAKQNDQRP